MENGILQLVWQHSLQLSLVVLLAYGLGSLFARNRPHLAHALWGIVFVKAVILPYLALPTSLFFWFPVGTFSDQAPTTSTSKIVAYYELRQPLSPEQTPSRKNVQGLAPLQISETHSGSVSEPNKMSGQSASWTILTPPLLATVWISIALLRFSWLAARIQKLQRTVRLCALPESNASFQFAHREMQECLHQIMPRHWLRNRIRLVITATDIGPAVMGLFTPKLILPANLVSQCDPKTLRPILMHELIHVRRLDLFWGFLQVLATSLWWFNPLIHLASRRLDQETERCCDEETVAALQNKPLLYARSMLFVLQTQNSASNTFSFSGMRSMEFNAERMKRIMSLKNQAHKRTPGWILAVMLAGILVAVPGATIAQVDSTDDKNISSKPQVEPAKKSVETLVAYQITDTLAKIRLDATDEESRKLLREFVANAILQTTLDTKKTGNLPTPEEHTAMLESVLSGVQWNEDKQLIVKATSAQHESVRKIIQHLNLFGATQLALSTKIVSLTKKQFETLDLTWAVQTSPANFLPANIDSGIPQFTPPILVTDIDTQKCDDMLNQIFANGKATCQSAPQIAVYNGQKAAIFTGSQHAYATDFVKRADAEVNAQEAFILSEGISISSTPQWIEGKFKLNLVVALAKIENVTQVSFRTESKDGVQTANLEVPTVNGIRFQCGENPLPPKRSLIAATVDPNQKDHMLLIIATCRKLND